MTNVERSVPMDTLPPEIFFDPHAVIAHDFTIFVAEKRKRQTVFVE